ncbi:hypothetical protein MDUV_05850 [Mycolicibacterium duvalii]|uniref:Uncharacterized protein n=1 Tax=Mycolicibacterium duvalii TaxID=39688 RepID=A0A7I7JV48_9MYCO|nr:hypothetical protein MDUV_05850 [Mycolicibacterium duvalii]
MLVAGGVLAGDDGSMVDTGQCGQCGVDFGEFDAVAADLDLVVGAAVVVQLAVGAPCYEVAGAVHAGAWWAVGGCQESGGGQVGSSEVAGGYAGAGDVEFAEHSGGHGVEVLVEDEQGRGGHGCADGRGSGSGGQGRGHGGVDGGLGGAVGVDQFPAGGPAVDDFGGAGFPAEKYGDGVESVWVQSGDGRGGLGQDGDVFVGEELV